MTIYCAGCGALNPNSPCACGETRTTDLAPSQEPCAYCGARPTWAVSWGQDGHVRAVWLCADCDEAEGRALEDDSL